MMSERLSSPELLVWAAIRRMDAFQAYPDLEIAPTPYGGGLFVDVYVPGGPARTFELDEARLWVIIDAGDRAAVEVATDGITAGIETAVGEVRDARE